MHHELDLEERGYQPYGLAGLDTSCGISMEDIIRSSPMSLCGYNLPRASVVNEMADIPPHTQKEIDILQGKYGDPDVEGAVVGASSSSSKSLLTKGVKIGKKTNFRLGKNLFIGFVC